MQWPVGGFFKFAVPLVKVEGLFYVNEHLKRLMYDELQHHTDSKGM